MRKKLTSILCAALVLCSLMTPAAFAAEAASEPTAAATAVAPRASDWFSGGTGTLNSMAGNMSKLDPVSSGSLPDKAKVTGVEVNVTVSRGSIPFYLVVVSPDGREAERYISGSCRVSFDEFNDKDAYGRWYIYIYNKGTVFTDVSTANASMTVTYTYPGW